MAKKLVIVASGPSLNVHLALGHFQTLLASEIVDTMAFNKMDWWIRDNDLEWRPTHYLKVEYDVHIPLNRRRASITEHFANGRTKMWIAERFRPEFEVYWKSIGVFPDVEYIERCGLREHAGQLNWHSPGGWHFDGQGQPEFCVYGGTMNTALALAYRLGYELVAVIGADLGMTKENKHHCHPDYETYLDPWFRWDEQDDTLRNVHRWARDEFEKDGRKIYNAGIGGLLDVYPRIDLGRFVGDL